MKSNVMDFLMACMLIGSAQLTIMVIRLMMLAVVAYAG
jgi:hypothetical protein